MTLIFLIFFIFLFLLMFASSVIFSIIRWVLSLFGFGGQRKNNQGEYGRSESGRYNSSSTYSGTSSGWHYSPEAEYKRRKKKKIIQQDEGEYVNYEEIKK